MTTFLCTTGTSIAFGIRWNGDPEDYRAAIRARLNGLPADAFDRRASAELNSLHRNAIDHRDRVVLLHSDTDDGAVCAEELAHLVRRRLNVRSELRRIAGLQTLDGATFRRLGVPALLRALWDYVEADRDVYLNVTGGFKGVVPYMTLFGLIHRLPVIYIFEQSDDLLELPPFPIGLDLDRLALARPALDRLARGAQMRMGEFLRLLPLQRDDEPWYRTLVEEIPDGTLRLSVIGEMVAVARRQTVRLRRALAQEVAQADNDRRQRMHRMIRRAADPLWRAAHVHRFHGTDLTVLKWWNAPERMAGFRDGDSFCIAEIYLDHDRYEDDLRNKARDDYDPRSDFVDYPLPDEEPALGGGESVQPLPDYDDLLEAVRRPAGADLDEAVRRLRERLDVLTAQVRDKDEVLRRRNQRLGELLRQIADLRHDNEVLREERARLQARPPGGQDGSAGDGAA